jgi:hypothetical protein
MLPVSALLLLAAATDDVQVNVVYNQQQNGRRIAWRPSCQSFKPNNEGFN